jgi:hypothetical protein
MDWRSFVASLASSLAWPVVVAAVLIIFRTEIIKILQQPMKHMKAGPFEADWAVGAAQVKAGVSEGSRQHQLMSTSVARSVVAPAMLGPIDKNAASVVEGFKEVESELRQILRQIPEVDPAEVDEAPTDDLLRLATEKRALPASTLSSIDGLRQLRNLAVHRSGSLDATQTQDFAVLTDAVMYTMRNPPTAT